MASLPNIRQVPSPTTVTLNRISLSTKITKIQLIRNQMMIKNEIKIDLIGTPHDMEAVIQEESPQEIDQGIVTLEHGYVGS